MKRLCQHIYNRIVEGVQKGKDGYISAEWFQKTLTYLTLSVYGGIDWKKWRKLVNTAVPPPKGNMDQYKEWREHPLCKKTWLSYLAMREYEWRVLACAHVRIISAIAHARLKRQTMVASSDPIASENANWDLNIPNCFSKHIYLGQARSASSFSKPDGNV